MCAEYPDVRFHVDETHPDLVSYKRFQLHHRLIHHQNRMQSSAVNRRYHLQSRPLKFAQQGALLQPPLTSSALADKNNSISKAGI